MGSAHPSDAKVLPYTLDVTPTSTRVGQSITISMELDPQNFLAEEFDFEIGVYRAKDMNSRGWPRRTAKPVEKVVMKLFSARCALSDAECRDRYQGVFTAEQTGKYFVVGLTATSGRAGYPRPIPIRVTAART
jgi:hypothetical protein